MKQRWIALRDKIDALSVRERVMIFCAAAGSIAFIAHSFLLTPLFAREKELQTQIVQQQNNIGGIDAEITATVLAYVRDPDEANRARLAAIRNETLALTQNLRAMQSGLVAPEQVVPLLESMLKSHGRLRLVALDTLPVSAVSDPVDEPAAAEAAVTPAIKPGEAVKPVKPVASLYRHGVRLTVRGNYLDMVSYLGALEAMPAQFIWGKANLAVEEYPTSRLSVTVYTLSLDKKWMKL
ncbi:MAG: hypothetical protein ABIT83_05300 [Massilia sp.]